MNYEDLEKKLRDCQIDRTTGLSQDYRNEYAALISVYRCLNIEEAKEFLKKYAPKTYTERYSGKDDSMFFFNEKYTGSIKRLDELTKEFRSKDPEKVTPKYLFKTYAEVEFLLTRKPIKESISFYNSN